MSRLLDHIKPPIITDKALDAIRAQFIAGRLMPKRYGYVNEIVAGIIARLEISEDNNKVLQQTLADVRRDVEAAKKEIENATTQ